MMLQFVQSSSQRLQRLREQCRDKEAKEGIQYKSKESKDRESKVTETTSTLVDEEDKQEDGTKASESRINEVSSIVSESLDSRGSPKIRQSNKVIKDKNGNIVASSSSFFSSKSDYDVEDDYNDDDYVQ